MRKCEKTKCYNYLEEFGSTCQCSLFARWDNQKDALVRASFYCLIPLLNQLITKCKCVILCLQLSDSCNLKPVASLLLQKKRRYLSATCTDLMIFTFDDCNFNAIMTPDRHDMIDNKILQSIPILDCGKSIHTHADIKICFSNCPACVCGVVWNIVAGTTLSRKNCWIHILMKKQLKSEDISDRWKIFKELEL